jgi:hypothetical protein
MVPKFRSGGAEDLGALILKTIEKKWRKGGAAYAAGKTLVVFVNAGPAMWSPGKLARQLPEPLHFAAVWVVALRGVEAGKYVYTVTNLDVGAGDPPTLVVRIIEDFSAWDVSFT